MLDTADMAKPATVAATQQTAPITGRIRHRSEGSVMPRLGRSVAHPYLLAVGLPLCALGVTHVLEPWLEGTILPPMLAAVVVVGLYGGRTPGLLAIGIGALGLKYAFLPEVGTVLSWSFTSALRVGFFITLGGPLVWLCGSLREQHARSIQARLEAEMARAEADQQRTALDALLSAAPDAILSANRSGEILTWNRSAESIFGYAPEEVLGQPLTLLIGERSRALYEQAQHRLGASKPGTGTTMIELFARRKDGTPFPCEVALGSWNTGREVVYAALIRDITERRKSQFFIENIIGAQDAERRRIARELHDETGQALTSLLVRLRSLEGHLSNETSAQLASIEMIGQKLLDDIGRLSRGLHPSALDELGFEAALRRHTGEFAQAHHVDVQIEFIVLPSQRRLPDICEITLYRIAQEALTNVAKHAQATVVSITVGIQGDKVRMVIEDDGRGFDLKTVGALPGLGIVGISERAELLGGTVTVESEPTRGTALFVEIPIGKAEPE